MSSPGGWSDCLAVCSEMPCQSNRTADCYAVDEATCLETYRSGCILTQYSTVHSTVLYTNLHYNTLHYTTLPDCLLTHVTSPVSAKLLVQVGERDVRPAGGDGPGDAGGQRELLPHEPLPPHRRVPGLWQILPRHGLPHFW